VSLTDLPRETDWYMASGVETPSILGRCDRPEGSTGRLLLPDAVKITRLENSNLQVLMPNTCAVEFSQAGVNKYEPVHGKTSCDLQSYHSAPALQTISDGKLLFRSSEEAELALDYRIEQTLPDGQASTCDLSILFLQLTRGPLQAEVETIATFRECDFIESVERDGQGNTWVMLMEFVHDGPDSPCEKPSGTGTGLFKIPDATGVPELVSDYGYGFGGNIVFHGSRLLATYSDARNHDIRTATRQVVEIDTTTGAR